MVSSVLSIAAVTLIILASTAAATNHATATAAVLCRNSDTPSLCLRISAPLRHVNAWTMTVTAVKEATEVAVQAKAKAAFLALSPRLNARQKSGAEACAESYGDVLDGLRDSARFLATSRRRADVMNYLSAASFGVTECEEAFSEIPTAEFPLARINKQLRKYVSNALAMGDQLKSHW
ncbi:hypothetical protein KSP40_PGU011586 [Platanthera guangdongensis]|uniref:Pectinesterase inhibitor domain-containing protein n=1 Tax=Platanthera guangdongensis TaxID=2320717 RepID=A0ABR2LMG9_9ASPA